MDWDWAYSGVNKTVPRNAGPECAGFLNPTWRRLETVIVLALAAAAFKWGYQRISLPTAAYVRRDRGGRRALLVLMSLIWGMEIGYKFSSSTVIYLLNPCHVTTAIQLPLEAAIYWIQHGMMFVVPYYLLRLGGVYNVEEFADFSWNALSYSINLVYHFLILQTIAVPTEVNLNHMLCPAILDPFEGSYYRIAAAFHQAILCPLMCKTFCLVSAFFLTRFRPTKVKKTLCCEVAAPNSNGDTLELNHQHVD